MSRNHKVCLTCGVSVGQQFLSIDVDGDIFPSFFSYLLDAFLSNGEDSAGAAGTVIHAVCCSFNFVCNRKNGKIGKQFHIVPWREMLTGLCHVVLLVEASQEFLKHHSHCMIVKGRMQNLTLTIIYRL